MYALFSLFIDVTDFRWQGPSYPFYYPHYDNDEKFPPIELFGNFVTYSRRLPCF